MVIVDIGTKTEGKIPAIEFNDIKNFQWAKPSMLSWKNLTIGKVILSFPSRTSNKKRIDIIETFPKSSIVHGTVQSKIKGALIVNIDIDAFLPGSQIDTQAPKNLDQYIVQIVNFKIVQINFERKIS
jgi:small subunit ribosomal protein S1